MEEKVVRKTAVKRAPRKSVATEKATPRARAVRKTAEPSSVSVRKAPTRPAFQQSSSPFPKQSFKKLKVTLLIVFLFSVLLGVSVLIGMSDKGELDVARAISNRKQNASSDEERQTLLSVPTDQIQPTAPNGGLVGMGASESSVPEPTIEVSASSTDQSASSTPDSTSEAEVVPEIQATPNDSEVSSEPQATETTDIADIAEA